MRVCKKKGLGSKNIISFAPHKNGIYFDKVAITNNPLRYPVDTGVDFAIKSGFSDVYAKPDVYPPKNSHPRVYINADSVNKIKANLNHKQNINVYKEVLKYAELNETGKLLTNSNGNNYDTDALECAKANALMYLLYGNEQNALKAVNIMVNYLSTLKYNPSGTTMEFRGTGTAIVSASVVYDWCYSAESFSDELKEKMVYLCIEQANKLECGWPPSKMNGFYEGHSQENAIIKDMFAFAIAVYDEHPEIYDFVGGRIFEEFVPYFNNRYKDEASMHTQGDNYGISRLKYELNFNLLFHGMGYKNVINPNQLYMAYQIIIRSTPDGSTFNDGDVYSHAIKDDRYENSNAGSSVPFYASVLFSDPYMKGYFQEITPNPEKTLEAGDDFSPVMYIALNDTSLEGKSKYDLPYIVYGGNESGMLTARTGWSDGKNSDAMVVSMKLPERWKYEHQHLDAGNFEIYYKGPLAIDSGLYTSAGTSHQLNYNVRTIAHNTMLVYKPNEPEYINLKNNVTSVDGGQRGIYTYPENMTMDDVLSDKTKAGEVMFLDWGEDLSRPSYTYFKGDMTNWYSDKVSLFERSFMFLNFYDEVYPGALIVFDKVVSSDSNYKKTWLLHSQQEPEIQGNVTTVVRNEDGYNGKLVNETLLPYEHNIEKVGGSGYEYYYDGVNYSTTPDETYSDESGKWRIEISPKNDNEEDCFLNVLTVSENNNEIIPLDSELVETDLFYQVKIKDRVCLFSKNSDVISNRFSISESGSGELEYNITNLSEGTWNIKGGNLSFVKDVTAEGSVLNFKAPAGTYEISRIDTSSEEKDLSLKSNILKRMSPYIETYPYTFVNAYNTAVFSKTMFSYGYDVSEYGYMYAEDKDATLETEGVRKFRSISETNQAGQFGISIIDKQGILKTGHILKPYVIYKDNGSTKTIYGEPVEIYSPKISDVKCYAVTDDIGMGSLSAEGGVTSKTHIIKTDGLNGTNRSNLWITLLNIDLTKFGDAADISNYILNIYGNMTTPQGKANVDKMNLEAIGVSDISWSESDYTSTLSSPSHWYADYVNKKTVYDDVIIKLADTNKSWYKLDVTAFIKKELEAGKTHTTIALFANNDEASKNAVKDNPDTAENEEVRNALRFNYYTKDSAYMPYIEYQILSLEDDNQ